MGDAKLVAHWGASAEDDAVLDQLNVADIIIEVYVRPYGHARYLTDPIWSGFLRDSRIEQDGPVKMGTWTFKDFNHLLTRRVVKPPEGASHYEDYGTVSDVMRGLVRSHAAELADIDRQIPGLSVESDDETETDGLYGLDESRLVFGSNMPEWVRVNCLFQWGIYIYAGTETQQSSGEYAAIYRSADGYTWTQVYDGDPSVMYGELITAVNCFAEHGGILYAGCSSKDELLSGTWNSGHGVILRSTNGLDWGVAEFFADNKPVFSLASYNGNLYAGCRGSELDTDSIYVSADGLTWALEMGAFAPFAYATCNALFVWDGNLYAGFTGYRFVPAGSCPFGIRYDAYYHGVIRRYDGVTWSTVYSTSSGGNGMGISCFIEHDDVLYAGGGPPRFEYATWYQDCYVLDTYFVEMARIFRSQDGLVWENVGIISEEIACITSFISVASSGGNYLWASVGGNNPGMGSIWRSLDMETWTKIITPTIPYKICIALIDFGGLYLAGFGSFSSVNSPWPSTYQADYGDIWVVFPSIVDEEDAGVMGRWQVLLSKLQELAEQSGLHDFYIVGQDSFLYCGATPEFIFRVRSPYWGVDNRWDGTRGVGFSIPRGNVASVSLDTIRGSRPTFIYLLGPSADDERTILEFQNNTAVAESPWGRIEGVADAQGVESAQSLSSIGWSELELQGPTNEFNMEVQESIDGHYIGRRDTLPVVPSEPTFNLLYASYSLAAAKVWRSVDSGVSATTVHSEAGAGGFTGFVVCDDGSILASTGFDIGPDAQIFRSVDGGITWASVLTVAGEPWFYSITKTNTGAIVAGTGNTGRIYRSTDGGITWSLRLTIGATAEVRAIVVAPNGHLVALVGAGAKPRVYRSVDDGVTWAFTVQLNTSNDNNGFYSGFVVGSTVLAGTGYQKAEVWRSTDNGLTWTLAQSLSTITGGSLLISTVYCFSLDAVGNVIAGVSDDVCRSSDGGLSWVNIGMLAGQVRSLYLLPNDDILAGLNTGASAPVYRSENNGTTWTLDFTMLAADRAVYAIALPEVYVPMATSDDEANDDWGLGDVVTLWFHNAEATAQIIEVMLSATAGSPVYDVAAKFDVFTIQTESAYTITVGTIDPGQIWYSVDGGATFSFAQELFPGAYPIVWSMAKMQNGYAIAGGGDFLVNGTAKILTSPDGLDWTVTKSFPTEHMVENILVLANGNVLASTNGNALIYKSTDNGASWSEIYDFEAALGLEVIVYAMVEALDSSITAFVHINATNVGRFYRSTDEGLTWNLITTTVDKARIDNRGMIRLSNGWLLAMTYWIQPGVLPDGAAYLYRSTDNGASWSRVDTLASKMWLCVTQLANGTILAGGTQDSAEDGLISRSTDLGNTWTHSTIQDVSGEIYAIFDFAELPNDDILAVVSWDATAPQIWRSTDGGITFEYLSEIASVVDITNILVL